MTRSTRISADTRSGLLMALGTALLLAPFAVGAGNAALVSGVVIGALAISLGIAGTASNGRGTIPVAAQSAYDFGLALGLLVSAAALGVAGDQIALIVFGAAGLVALVIGSLTRYTATASPNFLQ
jgi:hypothetical protein